MLPPHAGLGSRATMRFATVCATKNAPLRLVSTTLSQSASVCSSTPFGHSDAGIVDQHVDRPEDLLDQPDGAPDAALIGDVQGDARDPAAAACDLALQLLELVELAGGEADRGAVPGQHLGKAPAEALRGAGDQSDAAGQIERIAHRGTPQGRYEPPLTGRITPLV